MVFVVGTNPGKIDFTVNTLPPVKVYSCKDGIGEIPPNLADLSILLIEIHSINGDLGWLSDMIHESECARGTETSKYHALTGHIPPSAAEEIATSIKDTYTPEEVEKRPALHAVLHLMEKIAEN